MPNTIRANYIGMCPEPKPGCIGTAVKTPGFDDPSSHEHLAWAFQADGDNTVYYVDDEELSPIHVRF